MPGPLLQFMLKTGAPKQDAEKLLLFLRSGFLLCSSFLGCVLHCLILPIRICDKKKSQRDSYIESVHSNVKKKMHLKFTRAIIRSLFSLRITLQKTCRRIDVTRCQRPSPHFRSRAKYAWGALLAQASRKFRPRGSRGDWRHSRPRFAMLVKGRLKNER